LSQQRAQQEAFLHQQEAQLQREEAQRQQQQEAQRQREEAERQKQDRRLHALLHSILYMFYTSKAERISLSLEIHWALFEVE